MNTYRIQIVTQGNSEIVAEGRETTHLIKANSLQNALDRFKAKKEKEVGGYNPYVVLDCFENKYY